MKRLPTRTVAETSGAIAAVVVALLLLGAIPRIRANRALVAAAETVRTESPGVYVIKAHPAADVDLSLAATTQAFQDSTLFARTSGYISRRYVDIGDHVRAGQVLAEIASPEIDQQLEQAKADYQQSQKALDQQKAALDLARATMARYRAADAESAVAKEAVDQSVAAVRTGEASVSAAEAYSESAAANVRRIEELRSFERIVAPFAGTVIQRNVDVGALITAGSPTNNAAVAPASVTGAAGGLFDVAQIDKLRVFVNVPQAYAENVKAGLPVHVSLRGRLTQALSGTVTRTANALDPATRTLLTEVDIDNASHHVLPGAFVYVGFSVSAAGTRWRLPATALLFDANGTRVAVVGADNTLHLHPVVVGRDFGDAIDVQSGLNGDESIVKQPTVSLQDGQRVRPLTSAPSGS